MKRTSPGSDHGIFWTLSSSSINVFKGDGESLCEYKMNVSFILLKVVFIKNFSVVKTSTEMESLKIYDLEVRIF